MRTSYDIIVILSRASSILRYFTLAEPPYHWRVALGQCPRCGNRLFASFGRSAFLTRCLGCKANVVTLSTVAVLRKFEVSRLRAHELSSYGATFEYLRDQCPNFTFSEYIPNGPAFVGGIRNEDVTALSFASDSLDLLTSNGVMEHVPEDVRGYAECFRVLKPGGMLIFTVPLYDTESTVKMASMEGDGKIVWHREPEYHDSRRGGPKSAPTFWRHSCRDMVDRVRQVGFSHVDLLDVVLSKAQGEPSKVVCAIK